MSNNLGIIVKSVGLMKSYGHTESVLCQDHARADIPSSGSL